MQEYFSNTIVICRPLFQEKQNTLLASLCGQYDIMVCSRILIETSQDTQWSFHCCKIQIVYLLQMLLEQQISFLVTTATTSELLTVRKTGLGKQKGTPDQCSL